MFDLPLEFDVTDQDIARSKRGDKNFCAIAFSARRVTGFSVIVDRGCISIWKINNDLTFSYEFSYYTMTKGLCDWTQVFDVGEFPVQPIRVRLFIDDDGDRIADIVDA